MDNPHCTLPAQAPAVPICLFLPWPHHPISEQQVPHLGQQLLSRGGERGSLHLSWSILHCSAALRYARSFHRSTSQQATRMNTALVSGGAWFLGQDGGMSHHLCLKQLAVPGDVALRTACPSCVLGGTSLCVQVAAAPQDWWPSSMPDPPVPPSGINTFRPSSNRGEKQVHSTKRLRVDVPRGWSRSGFPPFPAQRSV